MCKIYITDLIQKKGAVQHVRTTEFKKSEHVLKQSLQAVEGFTRFYSVIIFTL